VTLKSVATISVIAFLAGGLYFGNTGQLNFLGEDPRPDFKVEGLSCVGDRVAYTVNNTGDTVLGGDLSIASEDGEAYSRELGNLSSGETIRVLENFSGNFSDKEYNLTFEVQNVTASAACNGVEWWDTDWNNRMKLSVDGEAADRFSTAVDLSEVESCDSIRVTGPEHEQTFAHAVKNGCNVSSSLWVSGGGYEEYYVYYGNDEASESSAFLARESGSGLKGVWNYSQDPQTLDVESRHVCGVRESGQAICNGKAFGRDGKVTVSQAGAESVEVAAGVNNVCYMSPGGNVYCMGENRTEETQNYYDSDVEHVDSALLHTCILRENGTTECFGQDDFNRTNDYDAGDAVGVSASKWNTCVLTESGNTECFGSDLTDMSQDYTQGDAVDLAVGEWHTCVLTEEGDVSCYGGDKFGRTEAYTAGDAVDVAAGEVQTCVLKRNGNTECYGRETSGTDWDYSGGNAIDVAAGSDISCVLTLKGNVKCHGGAYADATTVLTEIKNPLGSYNTVESSQDSLQTVQGLLQ
jgi:hypothetical protein